MRFVDRDSRRGFFYTRLIDNGFESRPVMVCGESYILSVSSRVEAMEVAGLTSIQLQSLQFSTLLALTSISTIQLSPIETSTMTMPTKDLSIILVGDREGKSMSSSPVCCLLRHFGKNTNRRQSIRPKKDYEYAVDESTDSYFVHYHPLVTPSVSSSSASDSASPDAAADHEKLEVSLFACSS